ncbi:fumarylacetoacetate hydrolase family protein [Microdochium trichocladiopsis]|uniref:Fumarylacetoacetate hydrolase family protein n=1 Tax=Microdochium trichocladiopsis TaxID=1682393 RepID=A0A9P9BLL3_9PEZI|nr:fumarylacetoacetate hydrolase family protein [Microdochium trichocladiopsis]KAH7024520.1 fumarylacetoacetate hydrolase family protein [Microdochium trichocladiopsis]
MSSFRRLIRFIATEDGQSYFADLGTVACDLPPPGTSVTAASTTIQGLASLSAADKARTLTVASLLPPLPRDGVPIYCVGLNYRSHAKEAKLNIPSCPPLWTKPATSLASPGEDIPVNDFCAKSLLDYEGELVFVTSRDAKDISVAEAKDYILGYTVGNDLSCRKYQLAQNSGGQFFFAKAFDKFAPIGPTLISPEIFGDVSKHTLVTRVNGEVRQTAEFSGDLIFKPAQILSHMSQGTTIPAGTAVMTGTAAGVGAFMTPKTFLQDGDVVEVEMDGVGKLSNRIVFK